MGSLGASCVIGVNHDSTSCANFSECTIQHLDLRWNVNFQSKTIAASAELTVKILQNKVQHLKLDTSGLEIGRIYWSSSSDAPEQDLKFSLQEASSKVQCFGQNLVIDFPSALSAGNDISIKIDYKIPSGASALQWLEANQTADRKHPFLFSQCQAIHARSIVPCMDTPAVKQTYTAEVSVESPLVALMSAVASADPVPDPADPNRRLFKFEQKVPIPSYLLAIVVGYLERRELGSRCAVWSEPSLANACEYEFQETDNMLLTAEKLLGPYVWGRYDILVLPPSFPFGGMENPCMTFATPTLLAGDRSLTFVVAHEIAHSWTGNLVTNATWDHFWLNEGHTTFMERKISGKLARSEPHRHFLAFNGWKSLEYAVNEQMSPTDPLTRLVVDLGETDPDHAFSTVPYEKGHTLLFYLEQKVGGPAVFEEFLRSYIEEFKYKSITTDVWKDYLETYFGEKGIKFDDVNWESWLYTPGMPPLKPEYDQTLVEESTKLCDKWVSAKESQVESFKADEFIRMSAHQREEFLSQLLAAERLPHYKLIKMEELYELNATENSEIRFAWIRLGLRAQWPEIVPLAQQFVTAQGRMKFTRPVYKDMFEWEHTKQVATETFRKNRAFMHSTTEGIIAKMLQV